jgi:hypothetical protein
MTPTQILDLVERLDRSATHMLRFIRIGGGQLDDLMAYDSAKRAGHYANLLIDLAEQGKAA